MHRIQLRLAASVAAVGLLGALPSVGWADLNEGLIANWCFDACTANDCWDALNGTNYGATCVPWAPGNAFEFTGTDIVRFIPGSWDSAISDAFTIAGRVKWYGPNAFGRASVIFDGRDDSWDQAGLWFGVDVPGTFRLHMNQSGSTIDGVSTVPSDGTPTHLAIVFDGPNNLLRAFFNGQPDSSASTSAIYHDSDHQPAIGNNHWAPGDGQWATFNGVIDELRLYSRALSAEEIAQLAGGCACPSSPELSTWNDDANRDHNNCYNHATNRMNGEFVQPGVGGGDPIDYDAIGECNEDGTIPDGFAAFAAAVALGAQADCVELLSSDASVDPDDLEVPEGSCLVAAVAGCIPNLIYVGGDPACAFGPDYHWFRRNNDGTWSHKPGKDFARTEDDLAAPITNPAVLVDEVSEPHWDFNEDGTIDAYVDVNNNGQFDAGRTYYAKFCGWFAYRDAAPGPCNEGGGPNVHGSGDPPPRGLNHVPPGTLRVIETGASGVQYGWDITDPAEIAGLVGQYFGALTPIDAPDWQAQVGYHGFVLQAEAGVLGAVAGLWTEEDEVQIAVQAGALRITTYPGYSDEVFVSWYADSSCLEQSLLTDAATQLRLLESGVGQPGAPEGPAAGLVGTAYTFAAWTTDPECDAVYYRFDWGDGQQTEWLGPYASGERVEAAHAWGTAGPYEVKVQAKDEWACMSRWSAGSLVFVADLMATVDVAPDVLNPNAQGVWIACYIELAEGYDVANIDVGSVVLNQSVPAAPWPYEVGDYDHDGIADLMVKFDRQQVLAILPPGDAVEVLITGQVGEETFGGTDTVRVLPKTGLKSESPNQPQQALSSPVATGLE
jgi:hypothetical protein